MTVDLRKRQLYAQFVPLSLVRGFVDRLGEDERVIQPVELLLDRLGVVLHLGRLPVHLGLPIAPDLEHPLLEHLHVTRRRLQPPQLVDERPFELGLTDVHDAAWEPAMVVRVPAAVAFREAPSERLAARGAAHEIPQGKLWPVAEPGRDDRHDVSRDSLRAVEQRFGDQRLEVAAA